MSGGKGNKKYTVGYWYGMGAHLVLCHGPVDAVQEIRVGERTAWSGNVTASTSIYIDNPMLFGGEEREGGVAGHVDVMMGDSAQTPNPYLQQHLGADTPAFRGVVSLVLRRVLLSAINPYIKPWAVKVMRIPKWYPAKAEINGDANPAHIIRECLTNTDWGAGFPDADIDDDSFIAAADRLYAEGFGLSLLWDQETSIKAFIELVLQHIDGTLFVHPRTGRFTLRLIRDDYDINTLPVLGPGEVVRIEDFMRPSWGEIASQVTVLYRDENDKERSVTVQNLAVMQLNGSAANALTLRLPGISKPDLAAKVAARELRQASTPLAKVTLTASRKATDLVCGNVFKLNWPPYGIEQMVMRVIRVSYGDLTSGAVRIEAVEDVFGMPDTVYTTPPAMSGWANPLAPPSACPYQTAYEVPYWLIVRDFTGERESLLNDIDDLDGLVAVCGARPAATALGFKTLAALNAAAFENKGFFGGFTPTAMVADALPQSVSQVTVNLAGGVDLEDVQAGSLAIIDGEWVKVVSLNLTAQTVTLERAVLDTVPIAHQAGARIWFVDGFSHYIMPEYVAGETVQAKLLTRTSTETLAETSAPVMSLTLGARFTRPYPPGNVLINGKRYPTAVAGEITVSWATRNRRTQTAYLVLQTEGSITPEAGQTTTLRFYDGSGTLLREVTGLTGTSYTWPLAQEAADAGGQLADTLTIEVFAVRDGHESWQKHVISFERAGYGLQYGNYYGGVI